MCSKYRNTTSSKSENLCLRSALVEGVQDRMSLLRVDCKVNGSLFAREICYLFFPLVRTSFNHLKFWKIDHVFGANLFCEHPTKRLKPLLRKIEVLR